MLKVLTCVLLSGCWLVPLSAEDLGHVGQRPPSGSWSNEAHHDPQHHQSSDSDPGSPGREGNELLGLAPG